jgi:hypothetical protein
MGEGGSFLTAKTTSEKDTTAPAVPKPHEATAPETGSAAGKQAPAKPTEFLNDLAKSLGMKPDNVTAVFDKLNAFYQALATPVLPPQQNQNAIDNLQQPQVEVRPPGTNLNALDPPQQAPRRIETSHDEPIRPQPGPNTENAPRKRSEIKPSSDPTQQPIAGRPPSDDR